MRSKAAKIFLIILAVLVVLYIASELVIPRVAASYIKDRVKKKCPDATDVSVSVSSFPALKLLFKQYNKLTVKARTITIQGVTFDSIEISSSHYPEATFNAVLGEGEIKRFFSARNSNIVNPRISISGAALFVAGDVEVADRTITVSAFGTLKAVDGRLIYFLPEKIDAINIDLSSEDEQEIKNEIAKQALYTVREDLPFTISTIITKEGKLSIRGNANIEKALKVSLK